MRSHSEGGRRYFSCRRWCALDKVLDQRVHRAIAASLSSASASHAQQRFVPPTRRISTKLSTAAWDKFRLAKGRRLSLGRHRFCLTRDSLSSTPRSAGVPGVPSFGIDAADALDPAVTAKIVELSTDAD